MEVSSKPIYRFADIEIDPDRGCVRKNGREEYLRQQTFQLLLCLIKHRERMVTKHELVETIWQGAAVTDNAIVQCIADIRRSLGDDSRHARFIKTHPKVGYRFIGAVEEVFAVQTQDQPSAAVEPSPRKKIDESRAVLIRSKPKPLVLPRWAMMVTALVLVAVCLGAFYLSHRRSTASTATNLILHNEAGKRAVAVMFFDNESSSADIDWLREGLADMLITDLARSKNLAVLSRQQLGVLLDRIGHKESDRIKLDEAIDVARRSQAGIVVLGSFARLGEQIRIDVQLHDARDGQILTAERLVVEKPDQILTQVDLLSLKLASHLGSPPETETGATLSSVMTNNLEAYRYYSLGVGKAHALQSLDAIALFEKAVALDPRFAMAYARIGYTYAVAWSFPDRGRSYLEKAFQLSDRLSEKDRLYIAGWYATANSDFSGAIKSFQDIAARFPMEVEAYHQLGRLLAGEERNDEAIAVLKQGLVIDPDAKDLYNVLGGLYSDSGRHDEAITCFRRYTQLAPEEANAHDSLGSAYQWAGRDEEAEAEYNQALRLKPDFEIAIVHLGNLYFQQGRYQDAIKKYEQYIQNAPSDSERARGQNCIAHVERMGGDLEKAQRAANTALKYEKSAVEELFLIALRRDNLTRGSRLKDEIEGLQSIDRGHRLSPRQSLYFRAMFDLKSGRPDEAIAEFKEALTHRPQSWNIDAYEDCLANAYLEVGRLDEAIAEYERILRLNPNYPLVHYHLSQAYEKKADQTQAHAEYEQFLQVWNKADSDLPEVVYARKWLSK